MFVGRQRELAALGAFFQGEYRFKIAVVEGRAGVGTSRLCTEFLNGKGAVGVLSASPADSGANLRQACESVSDALTRAGVAVEQNGSRTWGDFFSLASKLSQATGKRPVIYIDNYPTVADTDSDFLPALTAAFADMQKQFAFLLISGEKDGFAKVGTPARFDDSLELRTTKFSIHPLGYEAASLSSPTTVDEAIDTYRKLGGMPWRGKSALDPFAELEHWGAELPNGTIGLAKALTQAPNPLMGLSEKEICEQLGIKPLGFKRLFNPFLRDKSSSGS